MNMLSVQRALGRLQGCLLAAQIQQLADRLAVDGYAPGIITHYVRLAGYFSRWLEARSIAARHMRSRHIREFQRTFVLPRKRRPMNESAWHTVSAVGNHLLRMLQESRPPKEPPRDAIRRGLDEFGRFQQETRGLQPSTMQQNRRYLDAFLREHLAGKAFWPERILPGTIRDAVIAFSKGHKTENTRRLTTALRAYYQYLIFKGRRAQRQLAAVPCIPAWRTTAPPKVLGAAQRRRFLNAFDRSSAIGKRDYAMAVCMLELGLRRVDVAALEMRHIDWRHGNLTVPNCKQRHAYVLPLTVTVGEALADYLRHGRPASDSPRVFLRHKPPRRPLVASSIGWPMQCAFSRAQIPAVTGTHILRRSIASRIHAGGGGVKEIADFLGHVSLETAGVYARTDENLLRAFAMPWPEEAQ